MSQLPSNVASQKQETHTTVVKRDVLFLYLRPVLVLCPIDVDTVEE